MADVVIVPAVLNAEQVSRRQYEYVIGLDLDDGDYTASGLVVDFTALTNTRNLPRAKPHKYPTRIEDLRLINQPAGYVVTLELGSSYTAAVLVRIFQSDDAVDPLDELTGAIPAALRAANAIVFAVRENN